MAVGAFLRLDGENQGLIKGGVTQKGREGLIEVTSWSWGAERNFAGTTPSGSATASEFHITKKRDRATPHLLNAFANSEGFDEWRLDLYDTSFQGLEVNTMRVELLNARLASDRYGGVDTGSSNPPDHEELTFVFEKITVTWLETGQVGTLEL